MHGGAYATIADMTTSMAAAAFDQRYTVSVELATSYYRSAPLDSKVFIKNKVNKIGGMLAFTECAFLNEVRILLSSFHYLLSVPIGSFIERGCISNDKAYEGIRIRT